MRTSREIEVYIPSMIKALLYLNYNDSSRFRRYMRRKRIEELEALLEWIKS